MRNLQVLRTMLSITLETAFRQCVPDFRGVAIAIEVHNAPTPPALWDEIVTVGEQLAAHYTTETLKSRSGIAATREAYKRCGKDPSRYRPACEQLARRFIQGKGLYSVNTLVDIGNLVSLVSGYATGLLDADKIVGNLRLGIGRADEAYEGIGRGQLNIDGLPVYRDEQGAVATPTSDSVRTELSSESKHLLFLINAYDGDLEHLTRMRQYAIELLQQYTDGRNGQSLFF